jgi:hypothetical protein
MRMATARLDSFNRGELHLVDAAGRSEVHFDIFGHCHNSMVYVGPPPRRQGVRRLGLFCATWPMGGPRANEAKPEAIEARVPRQNPRSNSVSERNPHDRNREGYSGAEDEELKAREKVGHLAGDQSYGSHILPRPAGGQGHLSKLSARGLVYHANGKREMANSASWGCISTASIRPFADRR